ncbi:ABC transporter permease [Methanobacterium paludis]|uniref:ABC-2 type transporter n=1 Tax=Methanobacterium paludis (strain DSM 25820 / JCM 18151 / SWAN1) TaxID=868131 RepID=F6D1U4_METPW|nr:ABC transporter permease [Methanobacterium paludis]AEG18571.1 ABC-2 type transporter [Methanobacterium paludis]
MKFMSIAVKDLKEIIRDRRSLFFILLFPMMFMLVFGFAFGNMGESNEPHNLAVVNYDQGTTLSGEQVNFGDNLTTLLGDVKYQSSDVHMFNITETNESTANQMVKQRDADAELIIPANFSKSASSLITITAQSVTSGSSVLTTTTGQNSSNTSTSTLIIRGDTGYMGFGTTQGILVGVLSGYQDQLVTNVQNSIKGTHGAEPQKYIQSKVEGIPGTESFTSFDFIAPGMIVFAILLLATSVAAILTKEVESGTLRRLKMSKMTSFDFLFGGVIPWSFVAAAQVIILFVVAIAMGFHWQGGIISLILAVIVGVIGGVSSISLGMIIAAFARDAKQASSLGTLIVVPMSFAVGAFFQLPQAVIGTFMGHTIQVYDFIPWTNTLNALRATLTYGGGWNAISFDVLMSLILTVILFVIGVFLFSRTRMRPEG